MTNLPNNLPQFLEYIEGLHPQNIALGLERIAQVYQRLCPSAFDCPVVTVAGTNGKGSTVAALTHIAQENKLKVASYTSPHLQQFNERIQLNGQPIDDEKLLEALGAVETARQEITLTYFEFTTLAALYYFHQQEADLVILEVGLGGRLDAVNIVEPTIAVITQIAKDHTQWLGENIKDIAREKAGIMRRNKAVVLGDTPLLNVLLEYAEDLGAVPHEAEKLRLNSQLHPNSIACAGKVAELLGLKVNIDSLSDVTLAGRYQKQVVNGQLHIIDVAHNTDAMQNLAAKLRTENVKQLHIVLGMLKDKDIEQAVQPLHALNPHYYCVSIAGERGLSAETLAQRLNYAGQVSCFDAVSQAQAAASSAYEPRDIILTTGSFYVYPEVLL